MARNVFGSKPVCNGDVAHYRGRDGALDCPTPPSEPDVQISRIRLSSW